MKILSANGCASKSGERCMILNHAHFIPDELSSIVRGDITRNSGGLRAESHVSVTKIFQVVSESASHTRHTRVHPRP
ncbi:hypothetical protein PHMEG_0007552 [Phytophthora megakarya]|uniref:Uncharacterized protein n=1 Tax=Phytophthora megakarya TaxID=4795 RepID=A0A225WMX4_9STRA|nr:hypothetical protein PHMEG_0007552 [Phytophthora megakarya]